MNLKGVAVVCCLVFAFVLCAQPCFGQSQVKEMLHRRLEPLETQADSMHLILSKISADYDVPLGFEAATQGEEPILSVMIQGRLLQDVLDDIVKKDPRYEWQIVDGVVNVRPKSQRDGLLASILETRVKVFEIPRETRLFQVRPEILKMPEVRALLEQSNVSVETDIKLGGEFVKFGKDFSLSRSNVTVREILNQIIRTSDIKYWVVNRYGKNKEFLVVNF